MQGTITTIKLDKGYGFIAVAGRPKDTFFHVHDLADDLEFGEQLQQRRVDFDLVARDGRERAVNVRPAD